MSLYVAGLDLGQAQDFTALVVAEVRGTMTQAPYQDELLGLPLDRYLLLEMPPLTNVNLLHIERFQLGTKYQRIAQLMAERVQYIPNPRYLAVDQTGVGMGVFEMLAGLNPIGITITGGAQTTMPEPNRWRVPKRDLVAALQIPFQNRIAHYPLGTPFIQDLVRELENFKVKISASGHDSFESWREGIHDDLVLAASMSCWAGEMIMRETARQQIDALIARKAAKPYEWGEE